MPNNKVKVWTIAFVVFLLGFALGAPGPALAQGKVGVVDLERAVKECKQGKRALAQLNLKAQKFESEMKQLQADVQKLQKDLENTAMLLKPEARRLKERDLERKIRQARERQQDGRQELREAQRDSFDTIVRKMGRIIRDIGTRGKYALIVESKTTFYFPKSADITDSVIAAFDKGNP